MNATANRDFTKITSPINARGESKNPEILHNPRNVAIEAKTIFITDTTRKRVEVFNLSLDFLYLMPLPSSPVSKMIGEPLGLAISDNFIFLTHLLEFPENILFPQENEFSQSIAIFIIDGTFVTNYQHSKDEYLLLEEIKGIAVESDNTLYICETDGNKVTVIFTTLPNSLIFANIVRPKDVQVYLSYVIILSGSLREKCAHLALFTKSAVRIRDIVINEYRIHIFWRSPEYFAIDPTTGTFLISHIGKNVIYIYDWLGNYEGCIKDLFYNVKGLAVDEQSRIINVCEKFQSYLKVL